MKEKAICPLCDKKISFLNKSVVKFKDENICNDCVKKLAKKSINIFNIKKYDESSLKKVIQEYDTIPNKSKIRSNKNMLCCPNCQSSNIDLLANDKNMKIKQKTTINVNPLKPFTIANTKEVRKEKKSKGKLALGLVTGGTSLLVTGTNNKKHNEYFCRNCGNRWIGK